ncbi:TIGR04141 family sporadically distributed protein [Amycolatopsis silviterrae]|uniref:TIGR04141 family sporadically distributed protein n=1 Tax=Amycolatopsis silviterrae TaxID=1656914 RepID=A0ABW5H0C2_9PSEU
MSLYRLDGGLDLAEYLLSVDSADVRVNRRVYLGDVECFVMGGVLRSDAPSWADHVQSLTGIDFDFPGDMRFAVLLVPLPPWTYALTWGAGHLLVDSELIEQAFGLMFGIRRLDCARLGLVASSALDATARATQTSFPGGSDLGGFRLEPYGELVNRVAGPADLRGLTYGKETGKPYRIKVGNALWAPLAREPQALLADLRAIGEAVDEPDDHSALRFVAQTRPLPKSHPKRAELDSRLAAALGGDEAAGVLGLAWPDDAVRDVEEAGSFRIQRLGPWSSYVVDTNIELSAFTERFKLISPQDRLDNLKTARVVTCIDDVGQEESGSLTSLRKWFAFETTIDNVRYCYHQGKWLRIGEGFVNQIRDQVAALLKNRSNLSFPHWTPTGQRDDEHRFCELTAEQDGYVCLDRNFASTPFHPRFELCDVVGPGDEMVHVKWLGGAPAASHLMIQAQVAAQALRDESDVLEQLNTKVRALDPGRPYMDPSVIVLAAAGRTWDVDQLFTLSQLGLLRLHRTLRHLRCTLQFADIPYTPKKSSRAAKLAA